MTTKFNVEQNKIPNGSYAAKISGYECKFDVPGVGRVTVTMENGYRTVGMPAQVSVFNDVAVVSVNSQVIKCKE
jgi:hypothetical protein